MPKGLCREAVGAWEAYWVDVVAGVVRRSDEPLVERWARNLDRYYRLLATADADPIVTGSTGQPRPNPAYELGYKIEASIKDDEKQLGIGPLNRMRLGLALTEGRKSLTELNAEAESGANDDPRALFDRPAVAGGDSEAEVGSSVN